MQQMFRYRLNGISINWKLQVQVWDGIGWLCQKLCTQISKFYGKVLHLRSKHDEGAESLGTGMGPNGLDQFSCPRMGWGFNAWSH